MPAARAPDVTSRSPDHVPHRPSCRVGPSPSLVGRDVDCAARAGWSQHSLEDGIRQGEAGGAKPSTHPPKSNPICRSVLRPDGMCLGRGDRDANRMRVIRCGRAGGGGRRFLDARRPLHRATEPARRARRTRGPHRHHPPPAVGRIGAAGRLRADTDRTVATAPLSRRMRGKMMNSLWRTCLRPAEFRGSPLFRSCS